MVPDDLKLRCTCRVLNVAVTAGLVQLVARQAGAGGGTIGLNCITLIEQALVIQLLEKIPQCFYILIIISNIRVVGIHPIAHAFSKFCPLTGIFHNLAPAGIIIVVNADALAYVFLGDTEHFLHTKFHG